MSSSRSIAAARNRRAPESSLQARAPTKQPITSIQSQRAFVQPQSQQFSAPNNVHSNKLPFSKLTVSDAVGLITLRLGKVEQYLIGLQNNDTNVDTNNNSGGIDNSIITTIINRLDALEKKEMTNNNNQETIKHISNEIDSIKQTMRVVDNTVKNMANNFNNKFSDIDIAFTELEKCIDNNVSNKFGEMHESIVENLQENIATDKSSEKDKVDDEQDDEEDDAEAEAE